eukprot:1268778-Rhodomonas_salina.1
MAAAAAAKVTPKIHSRYLHLVQCVHPWSDVSNPPCDDAVEPGLVLQGLTSWCTRTHASGSNFVVHSCGCSLNCCLLTLSPRPALSLFLTLLLAHFLAEQVTAIVDKFKDTILGFHNEVGGRVTAIHDLFNHIALTNKRPPLPPQAVA